MTCDIYSMGTTRTQSNESYAHESEKDCCFSEAEGWPTNEVSEQQLPPRPELLFDDYEEGEG